MDVVETLIVPEVPRVIDTEQLMVYIPLAMPDSAGIAKYDPLDFVVQDGTVSLQDDITLNKITVNTLEAKSIASDSGLLFTKVVDDQVKGKFGFEDNKLVMYLDSDFQRGRGLQIESDNITLHYGMLYRPYDVQSLKLSYDGVYIGSWYGNLKVFKGGLRLEAGYADGRYSDKYRYDYPFVINHSKSELSHSYQYRREGSEENVYYDVAKHSVILSDRNFKIESTDDYGNEYVTPFPYFKIKFKDKNGFVDDDNDPSVLLQSRSGAKLMLNGTAALNANTINLHTDNGNFLKITKNEIWIVGEPNLVVGNQTGSGLLVDTDKVAIGRYSAVGLGDRYIVINTFGDGSIKLVGPSADDNLTIASGKLITSNPLYYKDLPYLVDDLSTESESGINRALSANQGYQLKLQIDNINKYLPNNIRLDLDPSNYKLKVNLLASTGEISSSEVDLPLESMIVDGSYDNTTKDLTLTLNNGNDINIPLDGIIDGLINSAKSVTYAELLILRNQNELVAGQYYRITDYTCTVANVDNARSVHHDFDIIIFATDINKLSEDAFAVKKDGDTYFANADLDSWELKYCLDNDTTRFGWADTTNGKGVIYYLKDEYGNECPYDFKSIQFKRFIRQLYTYAESGFEAAGLDMYSDYKIGCKIRYSFPYGIPEDVKQAELEKLHTKMYDFCDYENSCVFLSSDWDSDYPFDYQFLNHTDKKTILKIASRTFSYKDSSNNSRTGQIKAIFEANIIGEDSYIWAYTFSYMNGQNYKEFTENEDKTLYDATIDNKANGKVSYQNSIREYTSDDVLQLNNNVFIAISPEYTYSNVFDFNCNSNSFGNYCNSNSFGNDCNSNSFGNSCYSNSFGNDCNSNSFGNSCYSNSFGNDCYYNSFGNYCNSNSFGNDCNSNSFGNSCYSNSFGNDCNSNSFGNYCNSNSFGNDCNENAFDYEIDKCTFPDGFKNNVSFDNGLLSYCDVDKTTGSLKLRVAGLDVLETIYDGDTLETKIHGLAIDNVPTEGSTNLVESGAVYDSVKKVDTKINAVLATLPTLTLTPTEGLTYRPRTDKPDEYACSGIGTAQGSDIVIAAVYDGHLVTAIGDGAFRNNAQIVTVTLPETIYELSLNSFSGCTNLTSIYLPTNLRIIGQNAFQNCSNLVIADISPNNRLTIIRDSAFNNCTKLTSFNIGPLTSLIGSQAFFNSGIYSVIIPATVTTWGSNGAIFRDCKKMTEVYFRGDLDEIPTRILSSVKCSIIDLRFCTKVPTLVLAYDLGVAVNGQIFVPSSLLEEWKAAPQWSNYSRYLVGV